MNGYTDENKCLSDLQSHIEYFEKAILEVSQHGKMDHFISLIEYNEKVGCLAARMEKPMKLVGTLASRDKKIPEYFEFFMQKIIGRLESGASEDKDYQVIFNYCNPFFGKQFFYEQKEEIITLDANIVIDYMKIIFGYKDPTNIVFYNSTRSSFEMQAEIVGNMDFRNAFVSNFSTANLDELSQKQKCSAKKALNLITSFNAVTKIIECSPDNDSHIDFITNQIKDPEKIRPVKALGQLKNGQKYWNPRTKTYYMQDVNRKRGAPKKTEYTKKESVTLMSSNMNYCFQDIPYVVGLIFDINQVHLKDEKYIWYKNANTNQRWWHIDDRHDPKKLISGTDLNRLKEYLEDHTTGRKITHNELLVGLSLRALSAVFIPSENTLLTRLNAQRIEFKLNGIFSFNLPIFIGSPKTHPHLYTYSAQFNDLESAKENHDPQIKKIIDAFGIPFDEIKNRIAEKMRIDMEIDLNATSSTVPIDFRKQIDKISTGDYLLSMQQFYDSGSTLQNIIPNYRGSFCALLARIPVSYWRDFFSIFAHQLIDIIRENSDFETILEYFPASDFFNALGSNPGLLVTLIVSATDLSTTMIYYKQDKDKDKLFDMLGNDRVEAILCDAEKLAVFLEKMPMDDCLCFLKKPVILYLIKKYTNSTDNLLVFLSLSSNKSLRLLDFFYEQEIAEALITTCTDFFRLVSVFPKYAFLHNPHLREHIKKIRWTSSREEVMSFYTFYTKNSDPIIKPSLDNAIRNNITNGKTMGQFLGHFSELKTIQDQNFLLMGLPQTESLSFLETIIKSPIDLYDVINLSGWVTIMLAINLSLKHLQTVQHTNEELDKLSTLVKSHGFFYKIKGNFDAFHESQLKNLTSITDNSLK